MRAQPPQRFTTARARIVLRNVSASVLCLAAGCAPAPESVTIGNVTEVTGVEISDPMDPTLTPTCSSDTGTAIDGAFLSADQAAITVSGLDEGDMVQITWDAETRNDGKPGHFRIDTTIGPAGPEGVVSYTARALGATIAMNEIREWHIRATSAQGTTCLTLPVPVAP